MGGYVAFTQLPAPYLSRTDLAIHKTFNRMRYSAHKGVFMPYPNFEGKHSLGAFFSPQDYLGYLRRNDLLPEFRVPQGVIFTYQS